MRLVKLAVNVGYVGCAPTGGEALLGGFNGRVDSSTSTAKSTTTTTAVQAASSEVRTSLRPLRPSAAAAATAAVEVKSAEPPVGVGEYG